MKKVISCQSSTVRAFAALFAIFAAFALNASGQDSTPCPADKVCISREAAIKAVEDDAKVKALEAELKAKDQAILDIKELLNRSRIEFAAASGENTSLRQNAVQDRAIIDLLLKSQKRKCLPFSICIGG